MKIANSQKQTIGKSTLIKYLNPSSLIQPKANRNRLEVSNIHCRSMQELDFNANMASQSSVTKQNLKSNIHHSSLFSDKESCKTDQEVGKSKSLSKFIAFFENSNLLNPSQIKKDNKELKKGNYNGFSYDMKISGNPHAANNKKIVKKKDKENINYQTLSSQREFHTINPNKSTLNVRHQNLSPNKFVSNQAQQNLLMKMRQVVQQHKKRQASFIEKINQVQSKNQQLIIQNSNLQREVQELTRKISTYEGKIKELQTKCKELQEKSRHVAIQSTKSSHKESREHDMVIKSLKKVINQQLNKIIELERFKIENQYLKEKYVHQESQYQSEKSFSQQEYSFEDQQKESKKSPSSFSSTHKLTSQSVSDYGQQNFKKSRPINIVSQNEGINKNAKHFKSFFQIEQSPIAAEENKKRNFRLNESSLDVLKKMHDRDKNEQKNQGPAMIKIIEAESSFSREAIEEVNEDNDENESESIVESRRKIELKHKSNQKQEEIAQAEDSILQEVDQYLTKWRNR